VVQIGLPDRLLQLRVPERNVSVETNTDRALARVEAIDPGMIGRVSSTNLCREILPFDTPSEKKIGNLVSTPGIPLGIQRKEVRDFGVSFPLGSSYLKGQ
jgi:hypothetical protein